MPLASIVLQVAAVAVLLGVAGTLVGAWRRRGTTTDEVSRLERVQAIAATVAPAGLAVGVFVESDIVDAVWVLAVLVVVVLAVVRHRRGEPPLPSWL